MENCPLSVLGICRTRLVARVRKMSKTEAPEKRSRELAYWPVERGATRATKGLGICRTRSLVEEVSFTCPTLPQLSAAVALHERRILGRETVDYAPAFLAL